MTTTWSVTPPADAAAVRHDLAAQAHYTYGDEGQAGSAEGEGSVTVVAPPPTADAFLSDLDWVYAQNHWGPVERDTSNGARATGDGNPITLNGTVYEKGLGVHANSEILYYLGGNCTTLRADMGIDDEVGDRGSVVFQVWADGEKVYDSGVMTGTSPTRTIEAGIAGADELKLVVDNAGAGQHDHADWAGARVACGAEKGG